MLLGTMTVNIEKLIDRMQSKYTLATLTSKRARDINKGFKVRIADFSGKPHEVALREIEQGVVNPTTPPPAPPRVVNPLA